METENGKTHRPRPRRPWRRRLLAIGLGTVSALVVGELAARLLVPAPFIPLFPQLRYRQGARPDFSVVPDQRGYTLDAPATINARGTRGPDVSTPKPGGTYRVLGIGDSFAFGVGVADDQTFLARLESLLDAGDVEGIVRVEVVNAGCTAYWTRDEVDWLERYGLALAPDLVVLQFYSNDVLAIGDWRDRDLEPFAIWARRDPALPSRIRPNVRWESELSARVRACLKRSRLLFALHHVIHQATHERISPWTRAILDGDRSPRLDAAWGLIEQELRRAKLALDPLGIPLMMTAVPLWPQLSDEAPRARYQSVLSEICERLRIPLLDLTPGCGRTTTDSSRSSSRTTGTSMRAATS